MTHAHDDIRVGTLCLPFTGNGWLMPWSEVVSNPLKAQRLAEEYREESRRLAEGMPEASRLDIADRVAYANNRIGDEGETLRPGRDAVLNGCINGRPLEVNGFWRDADWLLCRDGQWRPVEPGTFPLVARFAKSLGHGKSSLRAMAGRNRTGRLKGYGNAINAQAAAEFVRAYMEGL